MSDKTENHRRAAARHEEAADNHERAARFWEEQGDSERAGLQHEMAEYERRGADLETRWAALPDPESARGTAPAAQRGSPDTPHGEQTASSILSELANTLEQTAVLADKHAERHQQRGRPTDASKEREAAQSARDAAQRARSHSKQWHTQPGPHET